MLRLSLQAVTFPACEVKAIILFGAREKCRPIAKAGLCLSSLSWQSSYERINSTHDRCSWFFSVSASDKSPRRANVRVLADESNFIADLVRNSRELFFSRLSAIGSLRFVIQLNITAMQLLIRCPQSRDIPAVRLDNRAWTISIFTFFYLRNRGRIQLVAPILHYRAIFTNR